MDPSVPKPVWPAWGPRLLEGDVDYDIADFINDECGVEMHQYWRTEEEEEDKEVKDPRDARLKAVGLKASRLIFNSGEFDRLFDKYKRCGPYYKKYGGKLFTVILTALGMRVGANISEEQMAYAWSIYRSAGLFKEGIRQFRIALDDYEVGTPYDFGTMGLFETLEFERMTRNKLPIARQPRYVGHHGPRYFENGKPTPEAERAKFDRNAPLSCSYCGKPEPELSDGKKLSVCAKCKISRYCSKECQIAEWKIHKRGCFTPEEQKERAKGPNGPASYQVMLTDDGIRQVAVPIAPEHLQASQYII